MISHGGKPENIVKAREIMALKLRLSASDQKPSFSRSFLFVAFQSGLKKA